MNKIIFAANQSIGTDEELSQSDWFNGLDLPWLSLIVPRMRKLGYTVVIEEWSATHIEWQQADLIILGPIWGYHKKIEHFHRWLDLIEQQGTKLVNSPSWIRWNSNKRYLLELKERGFPVTETLYVSPSMDLDSVSTRAMAMSNAIVKGAVDAGGGSYWNGSSSGVKEWREKLGHLQLQTDGALIQPFVPELTQKGEFCFIFYDGVLSHALLRVAKRGEERVQSLYGGETYLVTECEGEPFIEMIRREFRPDLQLTPHDIKYAFDAIRNIHRDLVAFWQSKELPLPAYVRLDGVVTPNGFILMEVEGIEPDMGFHLLSDQHEEILERFIAACL